MKNSTNLLIFLGIISFVIMGCAKSDDSTTTTTDDDTVVTTGTNTPLTFRIDKQLKFNLFKNSF